MRKWVKIAIPIAIVIVVVFSYLLYLVIFGGIVDGFPSNGTLKAEQTSDTEIKFTIQGDVNDYYSDPVKFSECAYSLWIGNSSLSSDDYVFRDWNNDGSIDMKYTKVHGSGSSNANYHTDGETFFIVYFNDVDKSMYLSNNDTITVKSTEPLLWFVEYRIFLATDIHDGDGHGNYIGTLNGPERSGW